MGTKVYDNALDLITFSRASGGTYLGSDGLLKTASTNVPRIEYAADGTVKGLLIEEQRANLEDYSNFSAGWSISSATLSLNAAASPDGGSNAASVTSISGTSYGINSGGITVSAVAHTASAYFKANGFNYAKLTWLTAANAVDYAVFNLSNGTIAGGTYTSATIEELGNGWYRCSITSTLSATTGAGFYAWMSDGTLSRGSGVAGDGTSGIYVWGAQFEAGSFPTSYISTSGSTATRSADIASIPVSAFGYNQKAGTVVVDVLTPPTDQALVGPVYFNTTAFQNSRGFVKANAGNTGGGGRYVFAAYDGVATTLNIADANTGAFAKLAASYGGAESAVANGGAVSTGAARNPIPSNLRIGGRDTGNQSQCWIKSIQYLPRRLTNTQLQELTA